MMARIFQFLDENVILILIVLLIFLSFAFQKLRKASREQREAVFGLERELSNRHRSSAIALMISLGFLVLVEFLLVYLIIPFVSENNKYSAPTQEVVSFPASTIPPEIIGTIIARTPGSTGTSSGTTCIPGLIMITSPKPGDQIRGKISIIGTADIPNFGFYKYEFSPVVVESWTTIQAGREIITDAVLGEWDTSEITPGDYLLRLVVLDNQSQIYPACVIPVRILQP